MQKNIYFVYVIIQNKGEKKLKINELAEWFTVIFKSEAFL